VVSAATFGGTVTATNSAGPIEPAATAFDSSLGSRALRLWLATRPAFFPASILPVLVGTAWGYRAGGHFDAVSLCLALTATICVHAASNVLNDVGDEIGGADRGNEERIFPYTGGSRFIQNGVMNVREMKIWGVTLLLLAILPGAALIWRHGPMIAGFGLVGILLGVLYSIPKVQLSAHGLGETAVAAAFGVLPVVGAAWLQSGVVDGAAIAISIPIALWVAAILLVNEVPDIRADAAAGKNTLVVRWGIAATRRLYLTLQVAAIVAFLSAGAFGLIPWWVSLASLALLPPALAAGRSICDVRDDRGRLTKAIERTLKLHMLGSLLLGAAVLVAAFV
jgi:1,4-dihydroxy-2-naphthoate octaprenyltransferase